MTKNGAYPHSSRITMFAVAGLMVLAGIGTQAQAAQHDDECIVDGMNKQCNDFGSIMIPNQIDIRGDREVVEVTAELSTTYRNQDARWIQFSVRHVPLSGQSPVDIEFSKFYTEFGDVVVEKIEQPSSNELNIWIHMLDTPVEMPIVLEIEVGAADRGAFQLEALVMPFDRGYDTIKDASGEDRLLYTFSLVGVNEETSSGSGSSTGRATPAPFIVPALAVLALAAIWRRRQ